MARPDTTRMLSYKPFLSPQGAMQQGEGEADFSSFLPAVIPRALQDLQFLLPSLAPDGLEMQRLRARGFSMELVDYLLTTLQLLPIPHVKLDQFGPLPTGAGGAGGAVPREGDKAAVAKERRGSGVTKGEKVGVGYDAEMALNGTTDVKDEEADEASDEDEMTAEGPTFFRARGPADKGDARRTAEDKKASVDWAASLYRQRLARRIKREPMG